MDFPKILFCTALSASMDEMIKRSFKLAYRYEASLEVFHVTQESDSEKISEIKKNIEEHIQFARPKHLKSKPCVINIVSGKFKDAFIKRITTDDCLFILTGHTDKYENAFTDFTDFLVTLSLSKAHTFIFKHTANPQPITEMHYNLKFNYTDLRVLNALTTVGADLEITYNLHYSIKPGKKVKKDLKALSQLYGTRLHSNLARFKFVEHEELDFEVSYEAHDIMVITKDELIAASYNINQDPQAVLILNV